MMEEGRPGHATGSKTLPVSLLRRSHWRLEMARRRAKPRTAEWECCDSQQRWWAQLITPAAMTAFSCRTRTAQAQRHWLAMGRAGRSGEVGCAMPIHMHSFSELLCSSARRRAACAPAGSGAFADATAGRQRAAAGVLRSRAQQHSAVPEGLRAHSHVQRGKGGGAI